MMIGRSGHDTAKIHSAKYLTKLLRRKWEEWLAIADEFDRDHDAQVSLYTADYVDVRNPGFVVSHEELKELRVKIVKEL